MNLTHTNSALTATPAEGWDPREVSADQIRTVSVCDTQPVTAEGLRTLLDGCPDLGFSQAVDSLSHATELLKSSAPSVLLLDKAFGMQPILEWLQRLRVAAPVDLTAGTAIIIWGASVTEAEALRLLQAGSRGILRKTAG